MSGLIRERICEYILREEYIAKIVFKLAEDLENAENLHALCSLVPTILVMIHDHRPYEHILDDSAFFGAVQAVLFAGVNGLPAIPVPPSKHTKISSCPAAAVFKNSCSAPPSIPPASCAVSQRQTHLIRHGLVKKAVLENIAVSQLLLVNTSIRLHLINNTLHHHGLSRSMEHHRPTHTLHPYYIHNHSLGMNTHHSSRSNMLAQMVIRTISRLQLPHLDPLTTMDNHPTIPPVGPPLIFHHGTPLPLPLPLIHNSSSAPFHAQSYEFDHQQPYPNSSASDYYQPSNSTHSQAHPPRVTSPAPSRYMEQLS
ncbi:hypothetical protein EV424DRAFT_1547832 [Suillus variegatus]|nr:hypothetical protein EV424DRAFT_1547832 [Suillus variegatus]